MAKSPPEEDPKAALTAKIIRGLYADGLRDVQSELRNYWLNHAFVQGHQWLWYAPKTNRLDELPRDPDRVQATINRMWPNSRTIISKAMQRELTFEVDPTGADDDSVRGARTSEAVLEAVRVEHKWELLREKGYWTGWKGGCYAICVDWDPTAGHPVVPGDGNNNETLKGGDTVEQVLSVAEFVVQPGVRDAETATWWIKVEALPPSTVMAAYKLANLPAADANAGMSGFEQKIRSIGHSPDTTMDSRLTLVLTYYERPNPNRPKGAIAVLVGEEIVAGGVKDWPFPWTEHLNFAVGYETPNETKWAGDTVLSQARPVQVALNMSWSSVIEHMKLAGNARLAIPHSGMDLIEELSDLPGEFLPYTDGTAVPSWISPPQMPAWWVEEPKRLKDELDDIMGVHDISRGEAPQNVNSGYGLSILAEQDTTPVGKMVKSSADCWSRVACMVLKLYVSEVKNTRKAIIRTPSQPPETAEWTGKELSDQTNATIPVEKVMPRNQAAMAAMADKMVEMKMITTFEQFATISELPGRQDLLQRMSPDIDKARWENHALIVGHVCVPEDFDDHGKHITEHNNFRKGPKYRTLSPKLQELYKVHIKGHETLAAEAAGKMLARAAVHPMLATAPNAEGTTGLLPGDVTAATPGPVAPPDPEMQGIADANGLPGGESVPDGDEASAPQGMAPGAP